MIETPLHIRIDTEDAAPEEILGKLKRGFVTKFLLALSKESRELIATIFPSTSVHSAKARTLGVTSESFQGAGRIYRRVANWDSDSCVSRFGRDCPVHPQEAEALLAYLQQKLFAFLEGVDGEKSPNQ